MLITMVFLVSLVVKVKWFSMHEDKTDRIQNTSKKGHKNYARTNLRISTWTYSGHYSFS